MSKQLKFVCAQPDDIFYTWQVHAWLESLRKLNLSNKAIVLLFTATEDLNPKWKQIMDLYPETEFKYYSDTDNIYPLLEIYVSTIRPYLLWKYFKEYPEMKNNAIFYCDCDILFTEKFNIEKFIDDDVCYVSDTTNYIGIDYFDGKIRDVLPQKLKEYKERDILAEVTKLVGISREICKRNEYDSGGAQYLLKNIDETFWLKVMNDCTLIYSHLQGVNEEFFENEEWGFQNWCTDMWSVLWNLWFIEKEVRIIRNLDFAWAHDPIKNLEFCTIYHNAGITELLYDNCPAFFKGAYRQGEDPFKEQHIQDVLNNTDSKKYCTWYYANALMEMYDKYKLNY